MPRPAARWGRLHRRAALLHDDDAVGAALGRADGVGHHQVREPLEELVLDRGREHRGGGRQRDQRRQVARRAGGLVERLDQRPAHGVAGDHERVDLLGLDQAPHLVGVELGHEDDAVAEEALAHDRPLGGAVHEGATGGNVSGPPMRSPARPGPQRCALAGEHVDAAAEGKHVLVAPDDALRHPGRAARVGCRGRRRSGAGSLARGAVGRACSKPIAGTGPAGRSPPSAPMNAVLQVGRWSTTPSTRSPNSASWTRALSWALENR